MSHYPFVPFCNSLKTRIQDINLTLSTAFNVSMPLGQFIQFANLLSLLLLCYFIVLLGRNLGAVLPILAPVGLCARSSL